MTTNKENLAKVFFDLSGQDFGPGAESVWAEYVKDNYFRIDNSPLYVYGVSYNDIVAVTVKEENLFFESVVKRGGYSTLRVFFKISDPNPTFIKEQLQPFVDIGCGYEGNGKRLYAIDVPPQVDVAKVIEILKDGENIGKWEYEEGYIHNPDHGSH